jgi:hypothetical protein
MMNIVHIYMLFPYAFHSFPLLLSYFHSASKQEMAVYTSKASKHPTPAILEQEGGGGGCRERRQQRQRGKSEPRREQGKAPSRQQQQGKAAADGEGGSLVRSGD